MHTGQFNLTSSNDWILVFRLERVMIFSGPPGPNLTADALVASEKVGEGGPGDELRFVIRKASSRSERDLLEGICKCNKVTGQDNEASLFRSPQIYIRSK